MSRDKAPLGVITGTGVTEHFELGRARKVTTSYGKATVYPSPDGRYVAIPRHGVAHGSPPHRVNYRANIAALEQLGVRLPAPQHAINRVNRPCPPGVEWLAPRRGGRPPCGGQRRDLRSHN